VPRRAMVQRIAAVRPPHPVPGGDGLG